MNRWTLLLAMVAIASLIAIGCSGSGSSPMVPDSNPGVTSQNASIQATQTHLWGYFDLYFDLANGTVEAVQNRGTQFTANVVTFVNNPPTNLAFNIHGTPVSVDFVDVDIDVSITHPFAGLNQYDGYDVRGVFVGKSSEILEYGSNLRYAAKAGGDQEMYDYDLGEEPGFEYTDPYDGLVGMPDGYTRWFNPVEFPAAGVLGYTQGRFASPGYSGTATLNPYKYFADGLEAEDDLWTFLNDPGYTDNGVFTAGTTNTRNYYLRFPIPDPNVKYGYAIVASWEDPNDPQYPPPNNCPEAVALSVGITPDIYYESASENGGDFIADLDVFGWEYQPSTITIETTVHSSPMSYDSFDVSAGGSSLFSTYSLDFTVDNITENTSAGGMDEFWVILEYSGMDYGSKFSPPGTYPDEPLAAFFRYDLYVHYERYNTDPVCDLQIVTAQPAVGWSPVAVEFDASASYDIDVGDVLSFEWDFDNDGTFGDAYDSGTDDMPVKNYDAAYNDQVGVHVTDGNGGEAYCYVDLEVQIGTLKDIDVSSDGNNALDFCMDHQSGDFMVLYDNSEVRRYDYDSAYLSYSTINVTNSEGDPMYIDMAENGYWFVFKLDPYPSSATNEYMRWEHFDPSDSYVYSYNYSLYVSSYTIYGPKDAICTYDNGTSHANDHCGVYGYKYSSSGNEYCYFRTRMDPSFTSYWYKYRYWYQSSYPTYGASYMRYPFLVAAEGDQNGDYIWVVEDDECTASRWNSSGSSTMTYSGPYFGTVAVPGDDDAHIAEPLDITTDVSGNMYILDLLSTSDVVIKHFSYTSVTTTPLTSFGTSAEYTYDPFRIDGSVATDGYLGVLCDDGTGGYYMSLFEQSEIPDS